MFQGDAIPQSCTRPLISAKINKTISRIYLSGAPNRKYNILIKSKLTIFVAGSCAGGQDGAQVHLSVFVQNDVLRLGHHQTLSMFVERILEAFDTLEAQRPGVLLADGRVERQQNVLQGHAAAGVQAEGRLVCAATGHRHIGRHLVRSNWPPPGHSFALGFQVVARAPFHIGMRMAPTCRISYSILLSTVRSAESRAYAIERARSDHCVRPTD